jgi:capsular polysaccharide export protein
MNAVAERDHFGVRAIGVARQASRLSAFFDGERRFVWLPPGVSPPPHWGGLAGWGAKGGARDEARRTGRAYLALEDGFLRSPGPAGLSYSLASDDLGVHYDAASPSRLEQLIADWRAIPEARLADARALMTLMRSENLGKYNDAPDIAEDHPLLAGAPLVLVADQVRGDRSIAGGGCDAGTFSAMLDAAVRENPGARVVARVHPNRRRDRRGHLREFAAARDVEVFDAPVSWMSLAKHATRVYVASSQAGLEALIAGAPVTCFGLPFYAGWGLTDDRQTCPRRTEQPQLEAVVAAAYDLYTRYLSPLTGRPISALAFARLLALRRRRDRETEGATHVLGVQGWKRPAVAPFLEGARSRVTYTLDPAEALGRQAREGGRIVAWSSRAPPDLPARCAAQGAAFWRLEDGFLRSVGLGAAMTPPFSLVTDRTGVYYDPSGPSDLEALLETSPFGPEMLEEAAALRRLIVDAGLSKYNVGTVRPDAFAEARGRLGVLVPGQVADDASVRLGGGEVRDNLGLLRAVRAAHPDAFIVFKPHPDVEAGLRPGRLQRGAVLELADAIATDTTMPALLAGADALHTLTSLAGFEALLRGVPVHVYGQPFYAGWGLTKDACTFPRRTRRLSVEALTAGVLLAYPRYADPRSGWPCSALDAAKLLITRRGERPGAAARLNAKVRQALARAVQLRRGG